MIFARTLLLFLLLTAFVATVPVSAQDADSTDSAGATIRASEGEPVGIWLNHVKPDKQAQFEEFMETFWKSGDAALAEGQMTETQTEVYRSVRVLLPQEPNEDSTYTYVFLADPLMPEAEYSLLSFLKLRHDDAEAEQIYGMFRDALARPQEGFYVQQSRY